MKTTYLLSALVTALSFAGQASATPSVCASAPMNLITNCGFETGTLSGWTATPAGYNGQYYGVDTVDANSGTYGAYLAGQSALFYISQTIATVAGKTYSITFDVAHPDSTFSPYTNTFLVNFAGSQLYTETNEVFGYEQIKLTGTATGSSTTLQFGAQDPLSFFSLDDVVVFATPEPATLSLLVLAMLSGFLWRRKALQASPTMR